MNERGLEIIEVKESCVVLQIELGNSTHQSIKPLHILLPPCMLYAKLNSVICKLLAYILDDYNIPICEEKSSVELRMDEQLLACKSSGD